jgi:hypothetical protein
MNVARELRDNVFRYGRAAVAWTSTCRDQPKHWQISGRSLRTESLYLSVAKFYAAAKEATTIGKTTFRGRKDILAEVGKLYGCSNRTVDEARSSIAPSTSKDVP